MKEYMEKLYHKLHEAMEKPVTLGSAEEVMVYADTICALHKLGDDHFRESTKMMEFTEDDAKAWTANMQNADYYPVAVEFGINRPEFYAALAKAFLLDKDGPGPERKLMEYYEHIVRS